jgi:hypothetical protein
VAGVAGAIVNAAQKLRGPRRMAPTTRDVLIQAGRH